MDDIRSRLKAAEVKIEDAHDEINNLYQTVNTKTDENNVKVTINNTLRNMGYLSEQEIKLMIERSEERMETSFKVSHLNLMKWVIGTGISTVTVILYFINVFN